MTVSTKYALASTTAFFASAVAASAMTIGITQNNVGVDSYQTTYEQAFIAAAEAEPGCRGRPCSNRRRRRAPVRISA